MARPLRLALLQTAPKATPEGALAHALGLAQDALQSAPQLLLLPEYCGGLTTRDRAFRPPLFREDEHPLLDAMQTFARQHRVWIAVGSLGIRSDDETERFCNRGYLIDDHGRTAASYDKLHLFDFATPTGRRSHESDHVQAGAQAVLIDTPLARIGYSICYDLRFPQLYRRLAQAGAELLLVPSAFMRRTGDAHWQVLNRARAIENGAFVIAPCASGDIDGGGGSYGHSLVVDPWGEVLLDAGTAPGAYPCTIDLDTVTRVRESLPSLRHDREFAIRHIGIDTP